MITRERDIKLYPFNCLRRHAHGRGQSLSNKLAVPKDTHGMFMHHASVWL